MLEGNRLHSFKLPESNFPKPLNTRSWRHTKVHPKDQRFTEFTNKNKISLTLHSAKQCNSKGMFEMFLKHPGTGQSAAPLNNLIQSSAGQVYALTRVQELSFNSPELCGSLVIRQPKHHVRIFWLSSAKRKKLK